METNMHRVVTMLSVLKTNATDMNQEIILQNNILDDINEQVVENDLGLDVINKKCKKLISKKGCSIM